jgi:hypothetical protein
MAILGGARPGQGDDRALMFAADALADAIPTGDSPWAVEPFYDRAPACFISDPPH